MPLTPLPFGQAIARESFSIADTVEHMARAVPGLTLYEAIRTEAFRSRTATVGIGDLRLMASATQACRVEVEETGGWHLIVPYAGVASLRSDGKDYTLLSGGNALLLPNIRRYVERPTSSAVVISLNLTTLLETQRIVSGSPDIEPVLDHRPIELRLAKNAGMFRAFLEICRLIDTTLTTPNLAKVLGIDDVIYRWIVANLLQTDEDSRAIETTEQSRIDAVCDLVRSMVERPLTLTEMERVSGLSARALQYAFKSRFNCSPMEWQRHERMLEAQQRLCSLGPDDTITQLAYSMGFSSSAAFSSLYKRYFGEMPSETLKRIR